MMSVTEAGIPERRQNVVNCHVLNKNHKSIWWNGGVGKPVRLSIKKKLRKKARYKILLRFQLSPREE